MSSVSDKMLVEFINRRNLPPTHPLHISGEMVKNLFDGRLVLADAGVPANIGRLLETGALVERLIKAGYHKATNGGRGMKASAYRKLWPRTVTQPPEYAGRFDEILLVDNTIELDELVRLGNISIFAQPESCEDLVLVMLDKDGQPPRRYVAFIQLGEKNLYRMVADCRISFAKKEVGLVTREGLHLPIQHESYLRQYAVDLAGSAYNEVGVPFVAWLGDARPRFDARSIDGQGSRCGSASRGSAVVAVS